MGGANPLYHWEESSKRGPFKNMRGRRRLRVFAFNIEFPHRGQPIKPNGQGLRTKHEKKGWELTLGRLLVIGDKGVTLQKQLLRGKVNFAHPKTTTFETCRDKKKPPARTPSKDGNSKKAKSGPIKITPNPTRAYQWKCSKNHAPGEARKP